MLSLFVHNHNSSNIPTILIFFLFFCRSRTLLSARRTCLRRRRCCAGPRRRPTSTPESTCRTSPSHGGMGSPSMPSSTETGESVFEKSKMLRRGSFVIGKPQITTETPVKEVTDSAATKSFSLSATAVERHNNTKIGQSHNFQLITAAAWQFGQMLLLLGCSRL